MRHTYDHGKLEKIRVRNKRERSSYLCTVCVRLGLTFLVNPMYVAIRLEPDDKNRFGHCGTIKL